VTLQEEFKKNKYVLLKDFLVKENCEQLTKQLKYLVRNQESIKDSQCPLSEALCYNSVFDKLLEDLLPYVEFTSGLKLFPTYSYARLYVTEEELKPHTDRPSCEISLSLTLGYEGDQWSIYMADIDEDNKEKTVIGEGDKEYHLKNISEIKMEVGDAVLYKGEDKCHWREKFKGKWQAQVFLHYVNQEGPYAEYKYDKRPRLAHHHADFDNFYYFQDAVSSGFCDTLIKEYSKKEVEKLPPLVGQDYDSRIDLNYRKVERLPLHLNQGIGATLTAYSLSINNDKWQYAVTHTNQTEFLVYDIDGKYEAHVDTFHMHSNETRKLTSIVFLNDDFEGGKFYIQTQKEKVYPPQAKGTIIVFPAFMLHGVEPVTKGIRYSVVSWLVGPYFK
jgi:hypothetical protein